MKGRIGGCSPGKETNQQLVVPCAVFLSYRGFGVFSLFPIVSYGNQQLLNSRICTLRVLLSQILNLTTSDTRKDGQSSPFTASSSQRVRGINNCRASIVAETEKPFLVEHRRLYPLTAVCFSDSTKTTLDYCLDRRPIQNRPLVKTKVTRPSIARTRHAHIHDVSYCCCWAAGL